MKRTIREPQRDVAVIHETDVLVVGSGLGGLAAALAAARAGVAVTLVDRFGCFGGNSTAVGSRASPGIDMKRRSRPAGSAASSRSGQRPRAWPSPRASR